MELSKWLEKMLSNLVGSWKTTLAGLFALLAVLSQEGSALFDGDPETVANLEAVVLAVSVFFGLSFSRDNDKRSEDVIK